MTIFASIRCLLKKHNGVKKQDMLKEYDFSGGVKGKYAKQFQKGSNVVALDADVAKAFPNSEFVNQILRDLTKIAHRRNT